MRQFLRILQILLITPQIVFADYVAHEWGTFTSLVGSDGKTQNGMHHEDEALPDFVHGFGKFVSQDKFLSFGHNPWIPDPEPTPEPDPNPQPEPPPPPPDECRGKGCIPFEFIANNLITQKMETPVIYFYTDREVQVDVNVQFPEGVITETYPAPIRTFPLRTSAPVLANGDTTFRVNVLPKLIGNIPAVEPGNIYAHARNVASNIVRSGNEEEKFIFYRGLGRFQPRIQVTSQNGALNIETTEQAKPQTMFLVDVDADGHAQSIYLGQGESTYVPADVIKILRDHRRSTFAPLKVGSHEDTRRELIYGLVFSGLNLDEATAMLDTWENGYLKVPGLRLLYVLPRQEVDEILPLTFSPQPQNLVRSFVARLEVMLDTDETALIERVKLEGSYLNVRELGRFAESQLRRALEVYSNSTAPNPDPFIVSAFESLIKRASQLD